MSLLMSSLWRLRVINLIGALAFTLYGVLIGAVPVAVVNILIAAIDVYYLRQMRRQVPAPVAASAPKPSQVGSSHP